MAHDVKLGGLIDEDQQRDAIHIAIAPIVAAMGEQLQPGQPIGFVDPEDNTSEVGAVPNPIGIVDPFLKTPVQQGERFWMFLMPNTITGLRHDWTHPRFKEKTKRDSGRKARLLEEEKAASEAWLRAFCAKSDCPDYDTLIEAVRGTLKLEYGSYYIDREYFHLVE